MVIETFTKEEIKNINSFRKPVMNKIINMIGAEEFDKRLGWIFERTLKKDELHLINELNRALVSLSNGKLKIIEYSAWYYLTQHHEERGSVELPINLKNKVVKYLYSKIFNTTLSNRNLKSAVDNLEKDVKNKYYEIIDEYFANGNTKVFSNTLYMASYDHWLIYMDLIYILLNNTGLILKYEENNNE